MPEAAVTAPNLTASVIVPTFNRCSRLRRLLVRLDEMYHAGSRFEVIVSVDGSTDGTDEMLASLGPSFPMRILHGKNAGPATARNHAMEAAEGEIIIFLDDDVVPVMSLIEQHIDVHRRDPAAAAIGPMLAPADIRMPPWLRWEAAMLERQYDVLASGFFAPTPLQFYTANASIRRAHALAAHGFDLRFHRAEDVEFAYRLAALGIRFYFLPEASIAHEPDRSLAGWLRLAYERGRENVMLERKGHPFGRALAYQETHRRRVNRLPPQWCVGHPNRSRVIMTGLSGLLRYRGPGQDRVHQALCSVMFNIRYWEGYADELGTGPKMWRRLETHWQVLATQPDPL